MPIPVERSTASTRPAVRAISVVSPLTGTGDKLSELYRTDIAIAQQEQTAAIKVSVSFLLISMFTEFDIFLQ